MLCAPNIISMEYSESCWPVGQKVTQKVFLSCWKGGKMFQLLHSTQHVSQANVYVLLLIHESGFFTILPYLVLTIFSPLFLCRLSNIVLVHSSSLCFPLMSCIQVVTLYSYGILLLLDLSYVIVSFVGGGGCLQI